MENETGFKLREAKFFLAMIDMAYKRYIEDNSYEGYDIVMFYFDAFLSSARSITFFMQKQYDDNIEFKAWYSHQQSIIRADPELKCLNEARVSCIHTKSVPLDNIERINFGSITKWDTNDPSKDPIITNSITHHVIEIFLPKCRYIEEDKNLLDFCRSQFIKLEKIVCECEDKFITM